MAAPGCPARGRAGGRGMAGEQSHDLAAFNPRGGAEGRPLDTLFGLDDHRPSHRENVTMDVGEWLRRLGLGQYEAVFRDSEIDADVLPEHEEQHLKDLGVSLGHRLKILRAIRELLAAEPVTEPPAPRPPQTAAPSSQVSAERRHLVHEHLRGAGRRGLARSRRRLSRCGLGGGSANGRPQSPPADRASRTILNKSCGDPTIDYAAICSLAGGDNASIAIKLIIRLSIAMRPLR
jgi:hypothetical protein